MNSGKHQKINFADFLKIREKLKFKLENFLKI